MSIVASLFFFEGNQRYLLLDLGRDAGVCATIAAARLGATRIENQFDLRRDRERETLRNTRNNLFFVCVSNQRSYFAASFTRVRASGNNTSKQEGIVFYVKIIFVKKKQQTNKQKNKQKKPTAIFIRNEILSRERRRNTRLFKARQLYIYMKKLFIFFQKKILFFFFFFIFEEKNKLATCSRPNRF